MDRVVPPIYRQVGRRLKAIRMAKGRTQEELAEQCKVGANHIGRIEAGSRRVRLETLEQISIALEVPLASLFPDLKPVPASKARSSGVREAVRGYPAPGFATETQIHEVISGLRELDRTSVSAVAVLVRQLLRAR